MSHLELRVGLLSLCTLTISLAVLISENGKVAVEYNYTQEEPTDSLTEEELKGLVQVRPADV